MTHSHSSHSESNRKLLESLPEVALKELLANVRVCAIQIFLVLIYAKGSVSFVTTAAFPTCVLQRYPRKGRSCNFWKGGSKLFLNQLVPSGSATEKTFAGIMISLLPTSLPLQDNLLQFSNLRPSINLRPLFAQKHLNRELTF